MAGYGQHYSGANGNGYRDSLGEHRPRSPLGEDPRRFAGDARRDATVEGDPCCMYIENLSIRTTENDLFEACEHWGDIRHVKLVKDKLSGVPRYAFITFANARGAAAALMRALLACIAAAWLLPTRSELNGRKVRVEAARGYRHGDPGADDYVYGKGIIAKRAPEALPPARMGPPADRYAQVPALADDYGGASRDGGGGAPYGSRPPPRRSGSRDRGGSGAYAAAGPPPRGGAPGGYPDDGWDEPDAM
ncbi:hypothetical protein JKP88DRAFT_308942 [Tribonema minus]|uniref:RRM domain-containing protein n=1 Tax=Tribonema minus TaxID=303371 RepID=A0A835Z8A6_9STRA|nr:hypothetical protein JKP88DRAFT_308942 [Tribonema minus]